MNQILGRRRCSKMHVAFLVNVGRIKQNVSRIIYPWVHVDIRGMQAAHHQVIIVSKLRQLLPLPTRRLKGLALKIYCLLLIQFGQER